MLACLLAWHGAAWCREAWLVSIANRIELQGFEGERFSCIQEAGVVNKRGQIENRPGQGQRRREGMQKKAGALPIS